MPSIRTGDFIVTVHQWEIHHVRRFPPRSTRRANRRLTAAVAVLFGILIIVLVGGALPYPKHIYASGITISGANGKNIGHFGTNSQGDGRITMYDRKGQPRILFVAGSDFGAVHFVDNNVELVGSIYGRDVTEDVEPAERFKAR